MEGLQDLSAAESADVVVIPAWHDDLSPPSDSLSEALRAAHGRGASIAGLCLGAFAVARARLLKGHPAVTLWQALDEFSRRHSDISVDQTVLYIDHRDVLTSAGTAAGIDACLHVVRTRLGADAANQVARSLVVAPHRGGGQAQYLERPVLPEKRPTSDPLKVVWPSLSTVELCKTEERGTRLAEHGGAG